MRHILWAIVLVVLLPGVVCAQTAIANPNTLTFTPSPDHALVFPDASPIVARYELRFYADGATQPVTAVDLAKPAPVNNLITIGLAGKLVGVPVGTRHTAKVVAVNPYGEGVSDASNPFFAAAGPRKTGPPTFAR